MEASDVATEREIAKIHRRLDGNSTSNPPRAETLVRQQSGEFSDFEGKTMREFADIRRIIGAPVQKPTPTSPLEPAPAPVTVASTLAGLTASDRKAWAARGVLIVTNVLIVAAAIAQALRHADVIK